jgi:hypothetical protein
MPPVVRPTCRVVSIFPLPRHWRRFRRLGLSSRPAHSGHVDPGRGVSASAGRHHLGLGHTPPFGGGDGQRGSVGPAQRAGEAAAVQVDILQDGAALGDAHAPLIGYVGAWWPWSGRNWADTHGARPPPASSDPDAQPAPPPPLPGRRTSVAVDLPRHTRQQLPHLNIHQRPHCRHHPVRTHQRRSMGQPRRHRGQPQRARRVVQRRTHRLVDLDAQCPSQQTGSAR